MSDPAAQTQVHSAKGSKKSKSDSKKKSVPNHPPISEMVGAAIAKLNERGGSSAQAIKKYIAGNYKVDVERLAPFIKKYLKSGVTSGTLVQTKGKGASGSFKLKAKERKPKAAKKPKTAKAPKPKSDKVKAKKVVKKKKPKTEKTEKPKKAPKEKKASPKKASKPKSAGEKKSKVEKKNKAPKSTKPKSPKKKAAAKPKKTPTKKASPKK